LTSFTALSDCFSAPYGPVLTLEKYRVSLREWGVTLSEKDINFSGYDCIEFVGNSNRCTTRTVYLKPPNIGFVSYRYEAPRGEVRYHETDELAEFDGIVYPKKGRTHIRYTNDYEKEPGNVHFEFDVTSVKRLTTQEMTPWMIECPEGTVGGNIDNISYEIPFPPGFLEQRMQTYIGDLQNNNKYRKWWISGFVLSTLAVVAGYTVYRRRCAS